MKKRKYQRARDRGSMSWGKFIWFGLVLMAICFALGSGMIYLADIAVEYNKKVEQRTKINTQAWQGR